MVGCRRIGRLVNWDSFIHKTSGVGRHANLLFGLVCILIGGFMFDSYVEFGRLMVTSKNLFLAFIGPFILPAVIWYVLRFHKTGGIRV